MAKQDINRGSAANDGTGDDLRTGAGKVNDNFGELYTYLGDGSSLSSDAVVTETATQTLTNKTITGTFTGNLTGNVTGQADTVAALTGLDTDDLSEGATNQYYTDARADARIAAAVVQDLSDVDQDLATTDAVQFQGITSRGDGASAVGSIVLNCEVNTHGQTIQSQPHSEAVTNTLTLPAGANSTLISEATLASNLPNESYSKFGTSTSPNLGLAQVTVGNFFLDEGGVNEVETSVTISGGRTTALVILNANVMNVTDGTTESLVEIERSTDGFATAGTKIGSFIFPVANTFYGSQHFSLLDTHGASDGDTVTYRLKNGNSVANSYSDESLRLVTGTCGDTIGVREI